MKILIVYASAGTGHRRAAEALYKELLKKKDIEVNLIDALDYTNLLFKYFYSHGYKFLIVRLPHIWGFLFYLTNNAIFSRLTTYPKTLINNLNSFRLKYFLVSLNPDVIISTHFFANGIIECLRKKHKINSRLISIITDFNAHRFWFSDSIDKYIVATNKTKDDLFTKGVADEKIKVLGIPVDPAFLGELDRHRLSQKFFIREDIFTVLIATGTIGMGPLKDLVNILKDHIQILIACGKNKNLFNELKKKESSNLKVFGLVDNIQELMAVSDILITKPGGLTISEALVARLPMIFLSLIPGQEDFNARVLSGYKAGVVANNLNKINNLILSYKNSKEVLQEFKSAIESIRKPNAINDILNLARDYAKS